MFSQVRLTHFPLSLLNHQPFLLIGTRQKQFDFLNLYPASLQMGTCL
jgi:hypothetical protein